MDGIKIIESEWIGTKRFLIFRSVDSNSSIKISYFLGSKGSERTLSRNKLYVYDMQEFRNRTDDAW